MGASPSAPGGDPPTDMLTTADGERLVAVHIEGAESGATPELLDRLGRHLDVLVRRCPSRH